jgi:hypothetical protein
MAQMEQDGTTIHAMVISPPPITSSLERKFGGLTDNSGNFFYQMMVSKYARPGQYMLNVQAIAPNDTRDNTPLETSTQNFTVVAK